MFLSLLGFGRHVDVKVFWGNMVLTILAVGQCGDHIRRQDYLLICKTILKVILKNQFVKFKAENEFLI